MTEVTKLAILTAPRIVAAIGPPVQKAGDAGLRNSRARLRIFRRPLSWPGLASKQFAFGVRNFRAGRTLARDCRPDSPFPRAGRLESLGRPLGGPFFIGETPGLAPGVSLFKSGNILVY